MAFNHDINHTTKQHWNVRNLYRRDHSHVIVNVVKTIATCNKLCVNDV